MLSGVLLTLGITGDILDWWGDLPFTINLLTSAAGASFGLPLAVLVLDTLAKQRTSLLDSQAAAQLSYRTMRRLAEALSGMSRLGGTAVTDTLLGDFYRLREQVNSCRMTGKLADPFSAQALIEEISDQLSENFSPVDRLGEQIVIAHLNWELFVTHAREAVGRQSLIADDILSKVGLLLKELERMDTRILDSNEFLLALEPIVRMETNPDIHPSAVETRYMVRHVDDVDLAVRLMQKTSEVAPSVRYAASALENRLKR
ncbi:hypothetical protein [Cryptosporangium sp. NPDC051539]|uniref:hypothetical protein n=1 Tax=Cryptosporangium sp. NPDC051539 TaxID=3363962 RepID=UPI0037910446